MTRASGLIATLVLVDDTGSVLGQLPPVEVATPWWNFVAPIVEAVWHRDGLRVTVLRLLSAERDEPPGGAVTYIAQLESPLAGVLLMPWTGSLLDHPLRLPYARIGGPHADLAWAHGVLVANGLEAAGHAEQIRTWNLSSIWRLPISTGGSAWLKVVPPFFGHEGAMLNLLADAPVPRLLGRDGCRMLLTEIDGEDLYEADLPQSLAMIDLLVELQARWTGRSEDLLPYGLPDWRAPAMTRAITELVDRRGSELPPDDRSRLSAFVAGLPERFDAIKSCGFPDSLVHGDFHRGNVRGVGRSLSLLDWGDCGVGHPLLDQSAFLSRIPQAFVEPARQHWARAWQRVLPSADVERAAVLLAPIASARQALIYQHFLDHIEPAEHPYHRTDVPHWLGRTAALT